MHHLEAAAFLGSDHLKETYGPDQTRDIKYLLQ